MSSPQAAAKPVALVTGVSSGIGRAAAASLAKAGYRVFGTSRKAAEGTIKDGIELLALDVTRQESVDEGVRTVLARAGRIDLLVNNAGVGMVGGAEESSIEQARALFEVNFFGTIRLIRAVVPHMRRQRTGRIVNISSVLGFLPAPFMALYASSKHAMEGYSESLDHELRQLGIRVVLVEPAYTKTAFDQNVIAPDAPLAIYERQHGLMEAMFGKVMKTADAPEVVAEVVVTAATAAKPKLRYTAGKLASRLSLLRRFAPASLVDAGIRKPIALDSMNLSSLLTDTLPLDR